MIDPKDLPTKVFPGIDLKWDSPRVPIRLTVELPFWLLIPDCELFLSHDRALISAAIKGNYVEVLEGPFYQESRANVVYVGPGIDSGSKELPRSVARTAKPIIRHMKTVVEIKADALADVLQAWQELAAAPREEPNKYCYAIRRRNEAHSYLYSLALAHIPFLNHLITSYRSASYDPCAFEVSEWDVPVWYAEHDGTLVRIGLMPYWDNDRYPELGAFGKADRSKVYATSIEAVQAQANQPVAAGKLELLDALSLAYRGRFGEAVRSAVTAIEVALEGQLSKLLEEKGCSDEQIQRRLAETRNSFQDRLADYEKVSQRRLPGPMVSILPWINGVRLESELWWVRYLRHDVVHRGIRIDISSAGLMQRAMETMTWLFRWLSLEDRHVHATKDSFTWFNAMHGMSLFPVEYGVSGVTVLRFPPHKIDSSVPIVTGGLVMEQYLKTISNPTDDIETTSEKAGDIDLFAKMSLTRLGVKGEDAPPQVAEDPILRERYHISHNGRQALVFCLAFDGLIDAATMGAVAARSLAHMRLRGPVWSTLCIIHHQRHLPTELREVENAIPDHVTRTAIECGITLITAPDLCFLVQGMIEHNWNQEAIRDLLFLPGRQGSLPPEYRRIGTYRRFFDKHSAMSVQLADGETVKVGDIIAIRLAARYHEERIESLEVDRNAVATATGPCKVGIRTNLRKSDLHEGQHVFIRT
jgi:hypothetical protein